MDLDGRALEGQVLCDRYQLVRGLAQGGMAHVFLGRDLLLARPVAVKIPLPHVASREPATGRFYREARAAARLSHPNVVAIYDTGADEGQEFIVMELVDGTSLRELLAQRGHLEVDETITIGVQVASALEFAHRAGLVHRDVKPGNILLTPMGQAKVTDFGIAKAIRDDDATQTGVTMGTARYLSPEQIDGRPLDGRADHYGLGVVLYEMLSGRVPFEGTNDVAVALGHLRRAPTSLRELCPQVPGWLDGVVLRCLEKAPDDRFTSTTELRHALEVGEAAIEEGREEAGEARSGVPSQTGMPAGATPAQKMLERTPASGTTAVGKASVAGARRRRRRLVPVAVGLVALAGLAALGVVLARAHRAPSPRTTPSAAAHTRRRVVPIVGALSYNPEGTGPEDPSQLGNLYDGNPATVWQTEWYANRNFGNLKSGTGFVLELGRQRDLGRLAVTTTTPGWTAQIFVSSRLGAEVNDWGQPVASVTDTGSLLSVSWAKTRGSYVLVWFTELGSARQAVIGEATLSS